MKPIAFSKRGESLKPWKLAPARALALLLLLGATAPVLGNPTGGAVVAGSATIGSAGLTLTINQSSHNAIINWQQFSIAGGELTKFIVPNSSSATLNRVTGGNPSAIYGTLQSNGILYLVNPNGIVVGPSGRIDTASFLASTLDVSNQQFLQGGNLDFAGASDASIDNQGMIHASSGDVYLIANQVTNHGTLSAPQGNVGLAAGSDVLFQQAGNQHLFVQATPAGTTRAAGVTNAGTIQAAAAELRAAGGNAYALAINNTGSIAATGYKKVNGQVYLTSDSGAISNSGTIRATTATKQGGQIHLASNSGTITNSGTLDTSATAAGGQGGSVTVKSSSGTTIDSGQILAKGGQGGAGGDAEVSGEQLQFTGSVDLTAPGGTTGNLLFDPENVIIQTSGPSTTTASGSPTDTFTGGVDDSILTIADLEAALASANITVTTGGAGSAGSQAGDITVNNAVSWSAATDLTLSAYHNVTVNANVTNTSIAGVKIVLQADNSGTGIGTVAFTGGAQVSNAGKVNILYNPADNPAGSVINSTSYTAPTDYSGDVTGGATLGAHMLVNTLDDLQNMQNNLGGTYALGRNIDATPTATWNGGAGFVPIGRYDGIDSSDSVTFQGTFNGEGYTINGLFINTPGSSSGTGLFGDTASSSTLKNVNLTNVDIVGGTYVGGLAAVCNSTVTDVSVSGSVTGTNYVGGLMGISSGAISDSYSLASVIGNPSGSSIGGLDGYAQFGSITDCYSSGLVTGGSSSVGGLLGSNSGTVTDSFWDTTTSGQATSAGGTGDPTATLLSAATYSGAGWSIGTDLTADTWVIFNGQTRPMLATEYSTTITNAHQLQLIGLNTTTLAANYTLANNIDLSGITDPSEVWGTSTGSGGGFVPIGNSTGGGITGTFNGQGYTINDLYINTPGTGYVGLFGEFITATVENVGLTNVQVVGNYDVAGLVGTAGSSGSTISNVYVTGSVTGNSIVSVGGLVGANYGAISNSYSTATVTAASGTEYVGGLVGYNVGTISNSYSTGAVSGDSNVGGFVGYNGGTISNSFWDITTSGFTSSTGGVGGGTNSGVTGATTTQLMTQSYIAANALTTPTWDFTSVWSTNGDTTLPQLIGVGSAPVITSGTDTLSGTAFTGNGVGGASGATIDLIFDGSLLGSTTTNGSGGFTFSISSADLTGGILLTDTATNGGNTFYQANSPASTISGIDIWGSTLRVVADAASNTALGQAIGSLTGHGIVYTLSGSNLSTGSGVNVNILSNYALDGNITASGAGILSTGPSAVLTGSTAVTLTASSVAMAGTFNSSGALTIASTTGGITFDDVGTSGSPATASALTLNATGAVDIQSSYLSLGGNFTATGNGYVSSSNANGEANGINLFDTTILSNGGNISLTGHAGYTSPGGGLIDGGLGVGIGSDGSTLATLSTTGSGNITITGTFNQNVTSQTYFSAVDIYQDGSASNINNLSVVNGTISITGTVSQGNSSGTGIDGVEIAAGSVLQATGTGSISLTGNTSAATTLSSGANSAFIHGIEFDSNLSVDSGDITLHGTSGTINTTNSTISGSNSDTPSTVGVAVNNGALVTTGANSTVTVTGTAGAVVTTGAFTGESAGVSFDDGTLVSMGSGGTLVVTGTGGAVNAGNGANAGDAGSDGVHINGDISLATGGSIAITGTGGSFDTHLASAITGSNLPTSEGIALNKGSDVAAAGTTTVTLLGTGGNVNAGSGRVGGSLGVRIGDDNSSSCLLTSVNGLIQITGTAGSAPGLGIGVVLYGFDLGSASVESTTGNITIAGTGGSGYTGSGVISGNYIPNNGITIADDVTVTTGGTISLTGTGGANSHGVIVEELTNDTTLDTVPVLPVITAGGAFTASSLAGTNLSLDGVINAATTTLTSPGTLTILDPALQDTLTTGSLVINAVGALNIDGAIAATGLVSILDTGANITFGPNGSISDSGSGNNVIVAAGSDLANAHEIINNSTVGESSANAIQVSGGNYYLYSSDLTGDTFGAISPDTVVYNATYATTGLPAANEELFYVASAGSGGGGGGGSGGTTPPPPSTTTGGAAGGGSNIVPPVLTTQPTPPVTPPQGAGNLGYVPPPQPISYTGNGTSDAGGQNGGGLAESTGNASQVGGNSSIEMGGGQVNNAANAQAAGALGQALGPVVYHSLSDALTTSGDWTPPETPGADVTSTGGDQETILGPGDVGEMDKDKKGVKNIPLDQAPQQLKNAMGGDVLNGVSGH